MPLAAQSIPVSSVVIDASALLALLLNEPGADIVAPRLADAVISAVNYSEVLTTSIERGNKLHDTIAQIGRFRLSHWPFDAEQAATAASLRLATRASGLSLADRACLGLGLILDLPILTADRAWLGLDIGVNVELIR